MSVNTYLSDLASSLVLSSTKKQYFYIGDNNQNEN
jgi:hypothetical protein